MFMHTTNRGFLTRFLHWPTTAPIILAFIFFFLFVLDIFISLLCGIALRKNCIDCGIRENIV